MKGRKLGALSAAAGFAGFVAALGRAWSAATKEGWLVDEELSEETDDDVGPDRRPFLPLLNGHPPQTPTGTTVD